MRASVIGISPVSNGTGLDPAFRPAEEWPSGAVGMWWLGQAGFALRHDDSLVLVDPYLSDSLADKYRGTLFPHRRMVPLPVAPESMTGVTAVLCTHGHTDHMDPRTIRGLLTRNDPWFLVPRARADLAVQRGAPADRVIGINAGEMVVLAENVTVAAIASAHETLETDGAGNHLYLGYIVQVGTVRIYHSGDCVPYEGQIAALARQNIDVALLPVNGRDKHRLANGVPGNFQATEAIGLCRAAGIQQLVAHHIGMFEFNTVAPDEIARQLSAEGSDVRWLLPDIGAEYVIHACSEEGVEA
jgi:L-ascorbate metabolism protein UlaG (beta-lactamase superfamily)